MQDASAAAQSATSAASTSQEPVGNESNRSGTVGKILGAAGLGTAAAGAGAATRSHDHPTTTTGVDSYITPTQSTPIQSGFASSEQAPRHHRKESIPTTAYPAGVDSPAAISAPVGGTTPSQGHERDGHTGRNVGLGAAGLGAGALGAHEYEKRHDDTSGLTTGSSGTYPTSSSATGPGHTQDSSNLGRGTYESAPLQEQEQDSHTGRNVGLGAAGLGAGALGAHEYENRDHREGNTGLATSSSGSYPTTSSTIAPGYSQDNTNTSRGAYASPESSATEQGRSTHNYGRDAGIAGVGAGAGALGAHEYEKRDHREGNTGSATGSSGTYPTTSSTTAPSYTQDSSNLSRGAYETPQSSATEQGRSTHNYGRDGAAAGLGAGAGALGAHEYEKRDHREGATGVLGQQTSTQPTSTTAAPSYTQVHPSLREDRNDPTASTAVDPERDDHRFGKTAAAAGIGAGAGAAGAYGLEHRHAEQGQSDWPLRGDSAQNQGASAVPSSQRDMETPSRAVPTQEQYTAPSGPPPSQSRYEEPSTKRSARDDAAVAGTAGAGAGAATTSKYDDNTTRADEEAKQRRRRHEEEAGLAGVAGAGAGAAGLHEHDKHSHEEDEARRQKELSEQEEARRKQYEKDQKAAEKEAKKEEKAMAKEEKAIAKEEKKQEKEAVKEEKKLEKERTKEEKQQQKELEKEESHHEKNASAIADREHQEGLDREIRERHEKEAAAGAGVGAAGGAAAYEVHDREKTFPPTTATDESGRNRLHKDPPEEKKPSLLKRLFGRRKNKDTGEDEDYEYEEGHEHDHSGAAGVGTGAGAAHDAPAGSYAAASGGATKPSYNPFTKDDPSTVGTGQASSADFAQQSGALHNPEAVNPTHDYPQDANEPSRF